MDIQTWNVLLIDDDEDEYLLSRDLLADTPRRRFNLDWASSYQAGLKNMCSGKYDAVLLDYDLGERTGIDLIREANQRDCRVPIIMVTGRGSYEVDIEAMQAGAVDYISKNDLNSALLERSIRYAIERHQSQQALLRSRKDVSEILESISDGFLALDREWRLIYINQRAASVGGKSVEECLGRNIWELWPFIVETPLLARYTEVMQNRVPAHFEMKSSILERWYQISVYPSEHGISVYWLDKTVQKQAELAREEMLAEVQGSRAQLERLAEEARIAAREARASSTQLEAILNSLSDAVLFYDPNGVVRMANSYAIAMFGFDPIRLDRRAIFNRLKKINEDGQPVAFEDIPATRAERGEIFLNFPMRLVNPRGREYSVIASAMPLFVGKEMFGVVAVYKDITDLRRAERVLKEQKQELAIRNQQLQGLFNYGPVGLAMLDAEFPYQVLAHNAIYQEMWGEPARTGGMAGKSIQEFLNDSDQNNILALFRDVAESGAGKTLFDLPFENTSGEQAWVNWTLSPVYGEAGKLVAFSHMMVDVTEGYKARLKEEAEREARKRAELSREVQRQLMLQRESERMQIARDLHDGLLQDLIGASFSLSAAMDQDDETSRQNKLLQVHELLQKNIRDLRIFCNDLRPPSLTPFGLERAIRSHAYSLKERYPGIEFALDLTPDRKLLSEETRVALFRIYQELLSNVLRHSSADRVNIALKISDNEVMLEVEDNGQGFQMPESWADMVRHGHLGLSGIRERVEAVGGSMDVASQPGEGTQVVVTVPVDITASEADSPST